MDKKLKIAYFKKGIPQVIDEINTDVITTLKKLDCQLLVIDLDPIQDARKAGNQDLCRNLQTEVINQLKSFQPDVALGYAFRGILPAGTDNHILNLLNIPYAGLFFDNPLYQTSNINCCSRKDNILIFCHDQALLPTIKEIGFTNSFYFPIGTSMHEFRQQEINVKKPLLFVGGVSMPQALNEWTKSFNPAQKCFASFTSQQVMTGNEIRQTAILQAFEIENPQYKGIFNINSLEFQAMWFKLDKGLTSELRYATVDAVANLGIQTCGSFVGWRDTFADNPNVQLTPTVDYRMDLPSLYHTSPIVINRSPLNLQNAIQQRILDVGAAGGFILTDYYPVLEDHFEIGKDIDVYRNLQELRQKAEFYLAHPEKRLDITANLHLNVLKNHTWSIRLKLLLSIIHQFI